jgi:hypothetical protein
MKRALASLAAGALALGATAFLAPAASATTPTLTLTHPSATALDGAPFTLTATASEAGTVAFSANSVAIPGCAAEVAVGSGTSFVATCPWTPSLTTVSPVTIGAELTPSVIADGVADATTVNVNTNSVKLTGSAVYLGQNAKFTATTYSVGTVTFNESSTPLAGCSSLANGLNGNGTAYVVSCTLTAPSTGGAISADFTPTNGSNTPGTDNYNLVVNTVLLSGGAGSVVSAASTITASANEPGTVEFDTVVAATPTPISGCASVTTTSLAVPYTFTCSYTPSAVGTAQLQATLTPSVGPTETSAQLAVTAANIVLSGGAAILGVSPGIIVASTSTTGTVTFDSMANSVATAIAGCSNVDVIGTAGSYVALCTWTPSAAGPAVLSASLTPTSGSPSTSANLNVTVGTPIQGQQFPISMYVDTIMGSGPTGTPIAPIIGAGCEITNEFLVGQTIVFRVYGNDAQLNGAPLTPANVSQAYVTVAGFAGSPITMSYGSHGGQAFWVGVLSTGTKVGQYNTLGVIPYTVTMKTVAVPGKPAVYKIVKIYQWRLVNVLVNGKWVKQWRHVLIGGKKVLVRPGVPAIPGATGTFNSAFNPASQATLNAVPTV